MLYTEGAVILGMVYNFLPFMILPIYSVLIKIDHSLIEAAEDLGAAADESLQQNYSAFERLRCHHRNYDGLFACGIDVCYFASFGGGKVNMVGNLIETQFLTSSDWGFGSALSVVVMVLILISMFIMNRFGDDEQGGGLF